MVESKKWWGEDKREKNTEGNGEQGLTQRRN